MMSHAHSYEKSRWSQMRPKVIFAASMTRKRADPPNQPRDTRKELTAFLEDMKVVGRQLRKDIDNDPPPKFLIRKASVVSIPKATRYVDQTFELQFKKACDNICRLCNKAMDPFKYLWYPCRVCNHVFHRKCVEKRGDFHRSDVISMDMAQTNTGWSCFVCGDLTLLLTEVEMQHLVDSFDTYHVKKGMKMDLEQFIKYKCQLSNDEQPTEDDRESMRIEFGLIDADKNGYISWWEFANHESKRLLAKRENNELVEILSDKEVVEARGVFDSLDENKDGFITELEALTAYKKWYQRFEPSVLVKDKKIICENPGLNLHAEQATQIVMDVKNSKSGNVSWEDFLWGQAVYIVCSRPNLARPTKLAPQLI